LKDTVNYVFSEKEILAIIQSFDRNEIIKLKGKNDYFSGFVTQPVLNLSIKYRQNDQVNSTLFINDEFNGGNTKSDQLVKSFHDDFLSIFKNNVHVKVTKKKIEKYNEENFPDIPLVL